MKTKRVAKRVLLYMRTWDITEERARAWINDTGTYPNDLPEATPEEKLSDYLRSKLLESVTLPRSALRRFIKHGITNPLTMVHKYRKHI